MTSTISPSTTGCIAFVSTAADAAGLTSWMNRLRKLHTVISVLEVSGNVERPLGVTESALRDAADHTRVIISGPRGTDREGVARRTHDIGRSGDSVFLTVDGSAAAADSILSALLVELREGGQDPELPGGTLFVNEAQELSAGTLEALNAFDAAAGFKIYLGVEQDMPELGGARIAVMPLSERKGDVIALVHAMLSSYRSPPKLDAEALEVLRDATWALDVEDLRMTVHRLATAFRGQAVGRDEVSLVLNGKTPAVDTPLADLEREHIYRVLDHHGWNRTRSAKALGIDVKTLYNKLKRYEATAKA